MASPSPLRPAALPGRCNAHWFRFRTAEELDDSVRFQTEKGLTCVCFYAEKELATQLLADGRSGGTQPVPATRNRHQFGLGARQIPMASQTIAVESLTRTCTEFTAVKGKGEAAPTHVAEPDLTAILKGTFVSSLTYRLMQIKDTEGIRLSSSESDDLNFVSKNSVQADVKENWSSGGTQTTTATTCRRERRRRTTMDPARVDASYAYAKRS